MLQVPTFEIGDKIRQLPGCYELKCPSCGWEGDDAEVCSKYANIWCGKCETIMQRGAEGWYVVEETEDSLIVLPYTLMEKSEE